MYTFRSQFSYWFLTYHGTYILLLSTLSRILYTLLGCVVSALPSYTPHDITEPIDISWILFLVFRSLSCIFGPICSFLSGLPHVILRSMWIVISHTLRYLVGCWGARLIICILRCGSAYIESCYDLILCMLGRYEYYIRNNVGSCASSLLYTLLHIYYLSSLPDPVEYICSCTRCYLLIYVRNPIFH